jgi:hypothetical protein
MQLAGGSPPLILKPLAPKATSRPRARLESPLTALAEDGAGSDLDDRLALAAEFAALLPQYVS